MKTYVLLIIFLLIFSGMLQGQCPETNFPNPNQKGDVQLDVRLIDAASSKDIAFASYCPTTWKNSWGANPVCDGQPYITVPVRFSFKCTQSTVKFTYSLWEKNSQSSSIAYNSSGWNFAYNSVLIQDNNHDITTVYNKNITAPVKTGFSYHVKVVYRKWHKLTGWSSPITIFSETFNIYNCCSPNPRFRINDFQGDFITVCVSTNIKLNLPGTVKFCYKRQYQIGIQECNSIGNSTGPTYGLTWLIDGSMPSAWGGFSSFDLKQYFKDLTASLPQPGFLPNHYYKITLYVGQPITQSMIVLHVIL